jgi:hypothetical protein
VPRTGLRRRAAKQMRGIQKQMPTTGGGANQRAVTETRCRRGGTLLTAEDLLNVGIRGDHTGADRRADGVERGVGVRVGVNERGESGVANLGLELARHELRPDRTGDGGAEGRADIVRREVETGNDGEVCAGQHDGSGEATSDLDSRSCLVRAWTEAWVG